MESKLEPELGVGRAVKTKGKKTIKTRILNVIKKKKRNIKKFFGRKDNTTSIKGGATTSSDVRQVNNNIKGGGTSNKDVVRARNQADTSITEVVIPASSLEPTTFDNVTTSTPSKEESKLHKNNKRPRDEIEPTISSTSDISSPKTPLQDGEKLKSKQLNQGSGPWSGSGLWSESRSTRSSISPADIHPGICSPVRKRSKIAVYGTAESATKASSDKKRKQPED